MEETRETRDAQGTDGQPRGTRRGRPRDGLRAARLGISLVFFVHGATYANWVPRIPLIKHALGLSDGALGIALLGAPVGVVLAVRMAGPAVARWGSRRVLRGASIAACASLVPIAFAPGLAALAAALLLTGAALGLMDVAMNAQGVIVERAYRRPVMSGLHGWYSVGALAGSLTGAAAAHYAVPPAVHFAIAAVILAVLAWFASRPLLDEEADNHDAGSGGRAARRRSPSPRSGHRAALLMLGVIGVCSFVGEGAAADWSAVLLRDNLGAAAGTAGIAYAGCSVAMAAGRLAGDRLVGRFGPVAVLRAGAVVSAAALAGGLLARQQAAAVIGFTLFGLGIAVVAPVTFSAAGNLPGIPSATAISRVTGTGYLGLLAGPPVIGFVAQLWGLRDALLIPATLSALIALLAPTARFASRRQGHGGAGAD